MAVPVKRINDYENLTTPKDDGEFLVSQDGVTYNITLAELKKAVGGGSGGGGNTIFISSPSDLTKEQARSLTMQDKISIDFNSATDISNMDDFESGILY